MARLAIPVNATMDIISISLEYSNLETNILTNCSHLNLQQFNIIKNRNNSILDLILSNSTNILVLCETDTLLPIDLITYHLALLITFHITENR